MKNYLEQDNEYLEKEAAYKIRLEKSRKVIERSLLERWIQRKREVPKVYTKNKKDTEII